MSQVQSATPWLATRPTRPAFIFQTAVHETAGATRSPRASVGTNLRRRRALGGEPEHSTALRCRSGRPGLATPPTDRNGRQLALVDAETLKTNIRNGSPRVHNGPNQRKLDNETLNAYAAARNCTRSRCPGHEPITVGGWLEMGKRLAFSGLRLQLWKPTFSCSMHVLISAPLTFTR